MSTKSTEGSTNNNGASNSPVASDEIIPESSPLSSINSSSSSNSDQSIKRIARNSGEGISQKNEEPDIELKSTRIINDNNEEGEASTRTSKSRVSKKQASSNTKIEKSAIPEDEDEEPIEDEEEDNDVEDEPSEITRCICGHQDLQLSNVQNKDKVDTSLFIQCDMCEVWQHGFCVGLLTNEDVPDVYFCEKCRPEYHVIVVRPNGRTSKYSPQDPSEEDVDVSENITRNKDSNLEKNDNDNDVDMADEEEDSSSSRSRSAKRKRGNKLETTSSPSSRRQSTQNSPRSPSVPATATTAASNSDNAHHSSVAAAAAAVAHSRHTRTRPTLNSQVYEENLRRALEESVHDSKPGDEDENEDPEMATHLRRTQSSRIRASEQKGGSSSSEEQSGNRTSSRRNQVKSSSSRSKCSMSLAKSGFQDDQGLDSKAYAGRKRNLDTAGIDDELSDSGVKAQSKKSNNFSNTGATFTNGKAATNGAEEELSSTNAPAASTPNKRNRTRIRGGTRGESPQTGSNNHRDHYSDSKFDCPSKPRIPPSRTSMPEMQKRVAALLEFISRTRQDLEIEHENRHKLLQYRTARFKEIYGGLDQGDISMELLRMQAQEGDSKTTQEKASDGSKSSSSSRSSGTSKGSKSKKPGNSSSQKDTTLPKSEFSASNGSESGSALAASTLLENYNDLLDESKFNVMFECYEPSVKLMESLTSKLIEWEERFGRYRES